MRLGLVPQRRDCCGEGMRWRLAFGGSPRRPENCQTLKTNILFVVLVVGCVGPKQRGKRRTLPIRQSHSRAAKETRVASRIGIYSYRLVFALKQSGLRTSTHCPVKAASSADPPCATAKRAALRSQW